MAVKNTLLENTKSMLDVANEEKQKLYDKVVYMNQELNTMMSKVTIDKGVGDNSCQNNNFNELEYAKLSLELFFARLKHKIALNKLKSKDTELIEINSKKESDQDKLISHIERNKMGVEEIET